ncbi:PP2C family protein-serine/threonine phosphatase [Streptomyces sp. NPDC001414]
MLVDIVVALVTPGLRWVSMLAVAPALTAARFGPRGVLVCGAVATAACVLLGLRPGSPGGDDAAAVIAELVAVTAASAVLSRLRLHHERRLIAVRSVAEAAQRAVLAPVPERVGTLRTAALYNAAAAEAGVGGDVYGAVATRFGTRALMADVRGKGLAAVGAAALTLAVFREAAHEEACLLDVAGRLERSIRRDLFDDDDFVTAVLIGFPAPGRLQLANCGHEPPLLVRDDAVTRLSPVVTVPPLGLLGFSGSAPVLQTVPFHPGDLLFLYTDGISEARNGAGDFFPLVPQLAKSLRPTPAATLDCLQQRLLRHVGGELRDDAALLLLQETTEA